MAPYIHNTKSTESGNSDSPSIVVTSSLEVTSVFASLYTKRKCHHFFFPQPGRVVTLIAAKEVRELSHNLTSLMQFMYTRTLQQLLSKSFF